MPHAFAVLAPRQLSAAAPSSFDWAMLTWAFVGGLLTVLVAGVLALALPRWLPAVSVGDTRRAGRTRIPDLRTPRNVGPDKTMPAGAKWTFADSWATNLTALITVTAAVVAVFADDLPDVFRDQAPLAFSLTTSVMVVVAALAPIAYGVLQRPSTHAADFGEASGGGSGEPQGTVWGWCASASLTLFAVSGSLFAAVRLVSDVRGSTGSGLGKFLACFLLVLVVFLVATYVITSFWTILRAVQPGSSVTLRSLVGLVDVTCCQGEENAPRTRMSLL